MEHRDEEQPTAKVIQLRPEPGDEPDQDSGQDDAREPSADGHAGERDDGELHEDSSGREQEADNVIRFDRTEPPNSVA